MSSSGLYHYPATIIDSRIATAFATFATTTGFSTTTVAGVINSFTGGRKQVRSTAEARWENYAKILDGLFHAFSNGLEFDIRCSPACLDPLGYSRNM